MAGKLTNNQMEQLEKWIDHGPKTFTLLYAITRDGCNAPTFHHKCDDQGPTVTVLYNREGSVYGGYAPVSWNNESEYMYNKEAFLFQLEFNGSNKTNKFPVKHGQYKSAMYNGQDKGPAFGAGHDLLTFQNTVNSSGTYFTLNGYMSGFGNSYDNQGINANQINNGNMNVTELEVYRVTDGKRSSNQPIKPWRKIKNWNEKFLSELTENIVSFKPNPDLGVKEARILTIGPVGAGKSSFNNTINSVFQGRITQKAYCGSAEKSLTTTYTPYKVKVKSGATLNFRLCDIPGLEESQGLDVHECSYLLDGNIPDFYEFNPTSAITPKTHGFKTTPKANDVIHCVVFVLDITTLDVLSTKIVEKIKGVQEIIKQRGIPQVILLTKIDKLSEDLGKDVSHVFSDPDVEECVEKASQLFGLPRSNVLPVKNYENEDEPEENKSILALLALRKVLDFTKDFLDQMLDKRNDEQPDNETNKLKK